MLRLKCTTCMYLDAEASDSSKQVLSSVVCVPEASGDWLYL